MTRLGWIGHVEHTGDADWIKCCTAIEVPWTELERGDIRGRRGGLVLMGIWSFGVS